MRNSVMTAVVSILGLLLSACGQSPKRGGYDSTGGDPRRGAAVIAYYGCGSCHTIPEIAGAHGLVGPPLSGIKNRMSIAGMLPNQPSNVERWIQNPKAVNARTLMPVLNVTQRDARDIAAFLYSSN
jgi:cytochrome c2